jgi:hypothetical protein
MRPRMRPNPIEFLNTKMITQIPTEPLFHLNKLIQKLLIDDKKCYFFG